MATTKARTTTYIDLDLDFTRNPATNDVSFKKDEEAIKRSVRNLVLTNFGERKFHPEIGSDAYSYLFENMSPLTAHNLERAVQEVIEVYEPRVTLRKVEVNAKLDENAYEVTVAFRINAIQKTVSISLFLERLN
tara:strand:+ start:47 stop:448 length:402 start_codon:yes stop_codon:yes gene_type:complete